MDRLKQFIRRYSFLVAGVLVLLGTCAAFAAWTVLPPELPVFTDPTAGTRGVTT